MNDTDEARFQRALDLVEWLDLRIAQQLEQRLTKEREASCVILAERIVEESQQILAMVEAEYRKLVELLRAEQEKMINLVEAAHERNKQLVEDVMERSELFVEGVIERMEERLRCSAELDRIDDADTRNAKERKKLS